MKIDQNFYNLPAHILAPNLLGKVIQINSKSIIITDVEAYLDENDLASHARFGRTKRSSIMYDNGGKLYVYMIYGLHFCTNVTANTKDIPSAVLIRGGKTIEGEYIIGPGRFSRYLDINKSYNGVNLLNNTNYYIKDYIKINKEDIIKTKRIGIEYSKEWKDKLLRFYINI